MGVLLKAAAHSGQHSVLVIGRPLLLHSRSTAPFHCVPQGVVQWYDFDEAHQVTWHMFEGYD